MQPSLMLLGTLAVAVALPTAAAAPASAQGAPESIAVIGTGELGSTLGKRWADAGYTVIYGSRTPDADRVRSLVAETGHGATAAGQAEAAASAAIVLLAVPATVVEEVVGDLGDLSGKLVIDPTNSAVLEDGYIAAPSDPRVAIAERVQALIPAARVVKAFNTLNYTVMADPSVAGGPVTIPIAGNDEAAKERVAALVRAIGLEPLDVGPLAAARYLEEMLRLHIAFRMLNPGLAFDYYLRVHPHQE